jgi:hypothetical protein
MNASVAIALLLAMTPALADEAAPVAGSAAAPGEPAKTRPPLKLRLDEVPGAAPRITFEPPEHASNPTAPDTLPALGGRTSPALEQKPAPGKRGSPYPPDTNPGL